MTREGRLSGVKTRTDLALAMTLSLILPGIVLLLGDPLYIGLWYYLAVPTAALALGLALRCPPFFLSGSVIAVVLTLATYMLINRHGREGLMVLGHLSSLPGAGVGLLMATLASRTRRHPLQCFGLALLGFLSGFLLNQLLICNSVMWCGPLSW